MPNESRRFGLDVFLISFAILFLELACIRWFPAHVVYLSFFTNLILLACFVGVSIGCLMASRPRNYLRDTPAWMLAAMGLSFVLELFRKQIERKISIGDARSPEVVFFGAEVAARSESSIHIPIEIFGGVFFLIIALVMIGPGQELGRAFRRMPNHGRAYTWNLLGSAAGIVLFSVVSYLGLPPLVWFAIGLLSLSFYLTAYDCAKRRLPVLLAALVLLVSADPLTWLQSNRSTEWSPYYRIDLEGDILRTNLVGHQRMWGRTVTSGDQVPQSYALPHLLNLSSGGNRFERIMVIGSGSGNDLSRALEWTTANGRIDAVEIDPVIRKIGIEKHPDRPYADPRVESQLNDGRNHLRKMAREHPGEFDAIFFGVVDSLVLHSGTSNLRLESFLFTRESFGDVKACLKPNGLFFVYNYFRRGYLVGRLHDALRETFDNEPIFITFPSLAEIGDDTQFDGFTLCIAGSKEATAKLDAAFAGNRFFRAEKGEFADGPAGENEIRLRRTKVRAAAGLLPATDDWPFFYQREAQIPGFTLRGMGVMLLATLLLAWIFLRRRAEMPKSPIRFDPRMFFLGAGFMLIETKAVVNLALIFGGTWMVNAFVFLGVLLLGMLANSWVAWVKPKSMLPYYLGLFATLGLQTTVSLDTFLGLGGTAQTIASCAIVLAPMFFAGTVFAATFARSENPDGAFGQNILGALVGGLAENASAWLGFRCLIILACGFYLLSIFERNSGGGNLPTAEAKV